MSPRHHQQDSSRRRSEGRGGPLGYLFDSHRLSWSSTPATTTVDQPYDGKLSPSEVVEKGREAVAGGKEEEEVMAALPETMCFLFPTYAYQTSHEDWVVRVKGRAFSKARPTRVNKLALGLARRVIGVEKGGENYEDFEQRFGLLLDDNSAELKLKVTAIGLSSAGTMVLDGVNRNAKNSGVSSFRTSTQDPHPSLPEFSSQTNSNSETRNLPSTGTETIEGKTCPIKKPFSTHFTSSHHSPNLPRNSCNFEYFPTTSFEVYSNSSKEIKELTTSREIGSHPTNNGGDLTREPPNLISIHVKHGHFHSNLTVPESTIHEWLPPQPSRQALILQGCDISHSKSIYGLAQLIEPAGVSVISDIDDTIKDTGVAKGKKHVLSSTFLHECKDVEGMADVYKYWALKGACFHYVSNSPWQIFPMLEQFFQKYSFPLGSAHLKFFETKSHKVIFYDPQAAKRESILKILKDFPKRKFVLVGDSGEMDLELYTSIARSHSQQIIKIFIRDVFHTLLADDPNHSVGSLTTPVSSNSKSSSFYKSLFSLSTPAPASKPPPSTTSSHQGSLMDHHPQHPPVRSHPTGDPHSHLVNQLNQLDLEDSPQSTIHLNDHDTSQSTDLCDSPAPLEISPPPSSTTPQLLRSKFMHRFAMATSQLPPQLVTIFESAHALLECPVMKLYLDLYPDQHTL